MRLGLFIDAKCIGTSGGAYTYTQTILNELDKRNELKEKFDVCLISRAAEKNFKQETVFPLFNINDFLTKKNFFIKVINAIYRMIKGRNIYKYSEERALNDLIKKEKLDLIWFSFPTLFRRVDCPYILTVWDLGHKVIPQFPEVYESGEGDYRELLYSTMISKAKFVITGNSAGAEQINKYYNLSREKIKELEFFTPQFVLENNYKKDLGELRQKWNLHGKYIFYPAHFWQHKNHIVILEALRKIKKISGEKISIVFSGTDKGNLEKIKEAIEEFGLETDVVFAGYITSEELLSFYDNALLMVYPSFLGPDNLPPYEAMARKCPVVLSDIPGHKEQCGDMALYFDPTDSDSLANVIAGILSGKIDCITRVREAYEFSLSNTVGVYLDNLTNIFEICKKES